jgi:hypothetical protein
LLFIVAILFLIDWLRSTDRPRRMGEKKGFTVTESETAEDRTAGASTCHATSRNIPHHVGLIFAAIHMTFVTLVAAYIWIHRYDAEISMVWLALLPLDYPIIKLCDPVIWCLRYLLPVPVAVGQVLSFFVFFGIYGSVMYYFVATTLCLLLRKLFRRSPRAQATSMPSIRGSSETTTTRLENPRMRQITRILGLYTFASLGVLLCVDVVSPDSIGDWVLSIWGPTYVLTWMFWVACMFRDWKRGEFVSRRLRLTWFWVLLLGTPILLSGPLAYYVSVYELRRGLTNRPSP